MSDPASKRKRVDKPDSRSAGAATGSPGKDRQLEETAFVGTRIKTSTMYTEAFGDADEYMEVNRPIPKPKAKSETKPKRKATERFIRADYSYEPFVEEATSSKQGQKQGKKQVSVSRTDLVDLLEKLTVDHLQTALARCAPDVSSVDRFSSLVEALETQLLQAKQIVCSTNEERWASFNTPYGETDPEVVEFLTNFVQNELTPEQQSVCVRNLIRSLLQNVTSPVNSSKGFGLMLAAQVLFRENPWALIENFAEIKRVLPKVSNVHQVPSNYAVVVQFIGAQLLANSDDDAPYAAFSYAMEILSYSGLHSKESMSIEFIARAFKRYTEAYGNAIDPAYTRLSSAVAERALVELSKLQPQHATKEPALKRILATIEPLKELIFRMALLSADHHAAHLLFQKTALHSPALCARVLPLLAHDNIQQYDDVCRRTIAQLARDLTPIVEGRLQKHQPPMDPAVKQATTEFVESFHIEIHEKHAHKTDAHSRRARAETEPTHRRKHSTSFCRRLFNLLFITGLIWASVYYWNNVMTESNKHFVRTVTSPARNAAHTAITAAKPHYDALCVAAKPHYDALCAATKPHIEAACAAVEPYYQPVRDAVQPHVVAFYNAALPHCQHAYEVSKVVAADIYVRLCELSVIISHLVRKSYVAAEPHIHTVLAEARVHLKSIGKYLDTVPAMVSSQYATHVAPHIAEAKAFLHPYTEPICTVVSPYWNFFLGYLSKVGEVLDKYGSFEE